MPAPTITALPPAPLRTQNPSQFSTAAEAFVEALEGLPGEINAFSAYLATLGLDPADLLTAEQVRDIIGTALVAGTGVTITVNDAGDTITIAAPSTPYILSFFVIDTPTASEVLMIHVAGAAFTIPADFTAALHSSVGTNPTASFELDVQHNGVTIGTITVGTGGAVTATTVGGTSKSIAAGDVLKIIAPSSADATAANIAFTIIGVR